jgi:RNA polymerase-binding transcription factor DksA
VTSSQCYCRADLAVWWSALPGVRLQDIASANKAICDWRHGRQSAFLPKPELLSSSVEGDDEKLPLFFGQTKEQVASVSWQSARFNLGSFAAGDSEASAFGMHQADAGSDAYDRDFALSLLSQEQDALYEIEEALKRVEAGTYGICEMSGKPIWT